METGMNDEAEIIARLQGVTIERLRVWVQRGWVRPAQTGDKTHFTHADIARAALVQDLQDLMGLDDETVPLVLKLIDQVHGLRRELKMLLEAVDQQPDAVREQIRSYRLERFSRLVERNSESA
jgi:chaperone modulatory protein CbpM